MSRQQLIAEFMNEPPEVHATAVGLASGGFLGLTWTTPFQEIGMAVGASVILCALGLKELSNRRLGKEIQAEAQYCLGAMVLMFALGFAVQIAV